MHCPPCADGEPEAERVGTCLGPRVGWYKWVGGGVSGGVIVVGR